jgi:hypothetical protein
LFLYFVCSTHRLNDDDDDDDGSSNWTCACVIWQ